MENSKRRLRITLDWTSRTESYIGRGPSSWTMRGEYIMDAESLEALMMQNLEIYMKSIERHMGYLEEFEKLPIEEQNKIADLINTMFKIPDRSGGYIA